MPAIKRLADSAVIPTSQLPVFVNGVWECGSARFTDALMEEYEAVPSYAPLTPMAFYLAFTPTERVAIKASTDATVREFWATYQLAVQTATPVDPNLVSVQAGLAYLKQQSILASQQRVDAILAGVPQ